MAMEIGVLFGIWYFTEGGWRGGSVLRGYGAFSCVFLSSCGIRNDFLRPVFYSNAFNVSSLVRCGILLVILDRKGERRARGAGIV